MDLKLEKNVLAKINSSFESKEFVISFKEEWNTNFIKRQFDILIYKEGIPLVIIEIKAKINSKIRLANAMAKIRSDLTITHARFGVLTNGNDYYIYDKSLKDGDFERLEYDEIIHKITDKIDVEFSEEQRAEIPVLFEAAREKHLSNNIELKSLIHSSEFLDSIRFSNSTNCFNFDFETDIENEMFKCILGEFKEGLVCRYSGFDTIFSMLSYLSFRMNGIAGMNDKSEINYVDNYIDNSEIPLKSLHHNSVSAMNRRYITSCSKIDRKDDLTLWRLYGDDAQGACLVFSVDNDNIHNNVLIQRVSYANEDGVHPELEFLREISDGIEDLTGFEFKFKKLGVWKHFFKPCDYAIEDEVRLLIVDNNRLAKIGKGWVKTYTHSILNPYIDFSLNNPDFPLRLEEIILGPKCPEQEINQIQFQELVRQKRKEIDDKNLSNDLSKLKVKLSDISHYR